MEYHDECIAIDLPEGFTFHDRPNYCTWNFTYDDSLIAVCVLTGERVSEMEGHIRSTRTGPYYGYIISGPHELQLKNCSAVYIESVVEIPEKFYSKQTQIVLSHADCSALVMINKHTHYDVSEYVPLLESLKVSMKEVDAARTSFVPIPRKRARKRQDETGTVTPTVQLPFELSYLQAAFDELHAWPAEEPVEDDDLFYSLLEDALRNRVKGLQLADAEETIEADRQELESWLELQDSEIPAAKILVGLLHPIHMSGLIAAIIESDS